MSPDFSYQKPPVFGFYYTPFSGKYKKPWPTPNSEQARGCIQKASIAKLFAAKLKKVMFVQAFDPILAERNAGRDLMES
jgi:hypothetical protein